MEQTISWPLRANLSLSAGIDSRRSLAVIGHIRAHAAIVERNVFPTITTTIYITANATQWFQG